MKRTPIKRGKPPKRSTKPIRQVSKKKARVKKYRYGLKAELIRERGVVCELRCSPHCTNTPDGLHEPLKQSARPFTVGDTRPVMLACNFCNGWIEDNPLKAKALGLSVSKYGGDENTYAKCCFCGAEIEGYGIETEGLLCRPCALAEDNY